MDGFAHDSRGGGDGHCDGRVGVGLNRDRLRDRVDGDDDAWCAGFEGVGGDEGEEVGVLVRDAHDAEPVALGERRERHAARLAGLSVGAGDRVAVGVESRVVEVSVECFEDHGGDGVLESFGLGVDGRPVEFEGLDEEGLDEAVSPEDVQSGPFALGGQAHAAEAFVPGELGPGELFDHGGRGAGGDTDHRGDA